MNNDLLSVGLEVLAGMIVIPWGVFVTVGIFNLKQQLAVLKAEMAVMQEVKELLHELRREVTK